VSKLTSLNHLVSKTRDTKSFTKSLSGEFTNIYLKLCSFPSFLLPAEENRSVLWIMIPVILIVLLIAVIIIVVKYRSKCRHRDHSQVLQEDQGSL